MKLNIYPSVRQAYVHPSEILELTFEEFVEFAEMQNRCLTNKEDTELFNLCTYLTEGYSSPAEDRFNPDLTKHPRTELIRRSKENVATIEALLLDVDGIMTLDNAVHQWSDWEFYIYSTYSNTEEKNKFRLVVPLAVPLTVAEFDARHHSMLSEFFGADGASFTISQAFYWPSYNHSNEQAKFSYYNRVAQRYNALDLRARQPRPQNQLQPSAAGPVTQDPKAIGVHRTMLTGSNLHYADAMPSAVMYKGLGLSYADWIDMLHATAAADSSLRTGEAKLEKLWQDAYQQHMTTVKMLELMKRMGCDTWRYIQTS